MPGGHLRECYRARIRRGYDPKLTFSAYSFNHEYDGEYYYIPHVTTLNSLIVKPNDTSIVFYGFRNHCNPTVLEARYKLGISESISLFLRRARDDPLLKCASTKLRGLRLRTTSLWNAAMIAVSQQNRGFLAAWKSLYRLHKMGTTTIIRRPDGRPVKLVSPLTPEGLITRLTNGIVSKRHIRTEDGLWLAHRLDLLEKFFQGKISQRRRQRLETEIKQFSKETGLGSFRVETLARIALFILRSHLEGKPVPRGPRLHRTLLSIKGIGSYTAGYIMMLYERDYTYPPVDRWTSKLASAAYGIEDNKEEAERELTKRFGKYAGLAIFFLSIVFDAQPIGKALKRIQKGELCPSWNGVTPLTLWKYNPENWSPVAS